jgi:hypothetical protein
MEVHKAGIFVITLFISLERAELSSETISRGFNHNLTATSQHSASDTIIE